MASKVAGISPEGLQKLYLCTLQLRVTNAVFIFDTSRKPLHATEAKFSRPNPMTDQDLKSYLIILNSY
jgi:hypothetical protein